MNQVESRTLLRRVVILPVVVALIYAGSMLWVSHNLDASLQWVNHTDQVISQSRRMYRLMVDMESGERGFLVTGNEAFLQPYQEAAKTIESELATLDRLVADSPAQQFRLMVLRGKLSHWQGDAERMIALRRTGGAYSDLQLNLTEKSEMDEIRGQVADFQGAEEKLRDSRSSTAHGSWYLVTYVNVLLGLGAGLGLALFMYLYDLHQRREEASKTQLALERSADRFDTLVAATPNVVYRMSPDWGEMLHLNGRSFIADTNAPNDNWFQQYVPPEDQQLVQSCMKEATRTKSKFELEHRVRRVDGGLGWTHSCALPLLDANGKILEWIGIASDITERKRAEDALEESEKRYRTMLSKMNTGFCVIEVIFDERGKPFDYRFLEVNEVFDQLTGLHEAAGKRVRELAPELEESWFEVYGRVAFTGEPEHIRMEAKQLKHFYDASAYRIDKPEQHHVAIVFHDITEQKRTEDRLRESEASLKETQKIAGLGSTVLDLRTEVWTRSEVLEEIFGIDQSYEHTKAGWMALIHPEDRVKVADYLDREVLSQKQSFGRNYHFNYRIIRPVDKAVRWIDSQRTLEFDVDGNPAILRGAARDITAQRQIEEQLRDAASVFSHSSEGIVITNPAGDIVDVNDAFLHITGYMRDEVLGLNPRILKSGRQDQKFYEGMWRALKENGQWSGEIWNQKKSGEMYCAMLTINAVFDANGEVQHYVALSHDISGLKEHERQLEQIAHYDILTGLPNRALLSDRLRQAMIQTHRRKQKLAVAMIDLDGFKAVNDNHGHDAGDLLLTTLGTRMKHILREGDTLARIGGDEFVAVLPDLDDVEASVQMFNRLLNAAAEPVLIGSSIVSVSASVGATFFPRQEGVDADQLLREADQAMYQAKLAGRNRYHIFDSTQDQFSLSRHESVKRIRQALTAREFILYYQPKVNMRTGEIVGAEALIRWQHPKQGLLAPDKFLPFIEDNPLAVELGEWVIDTALSQMEIWKAAGLNIPVSVNLSAKHLQQSNFADRLRMLLAAHPLVSPSSFELEVLETSALENLARTSLVLEACCRLGVSFALDDFGTGYSSLTYLKRLPADVLKIDQSFVREILHDKESLAIMESILWLATALGRQVIAEGVETTEHGLMLLQRGYELAQGYGIARPMPASDMPAWAASWHTDLQWASMPSLKISAKGWSTSFAGPN
jgi:diguanylate cyclase (GGDEF)-like protein/PAS domain S-box-containing protein